MMKKFQWFQLYPDHQQASRLSIAAGGVKLLSIFLLAAAILYSLALLLAGSRIAMAGGVGTALMFIMDELDDMVFGAFLLWGAFAVSRFAISVLRAKAELLSRSAAQAVSSPLADEADGREVQQVQETNAT